MRRAEPLISDPPPLCRLGSTFQSLACQTWCSSRPLPLSPSATRGNRGKVGGINASSGCAWMALEEEEACTRRCIAELYVAVLELLLQDFWEGRLRLSAPPPPLCLHR